MEEKDVREELVSGNGGVAMTERSRGFNVEGESQEASSALRNTARLTGVWYLGLAIAGLFGFFLIRPQIYVADDPAATLANLVDREGLARIGLGFELAIVLTQALAAVWFYKLFRSLNDAAAFALAVFGIVNAMAILASAAFMATALTVAGDARLAPGGDAAATVQLMYQLSSNLWGVGAVFFGLWLIPMGYIAASSGRMPKWLGRILIVGGSGYLLSAFVSYGIADAPAWLVAALPIPATIGEFWMIGYLLTKGIRDLPAGTKSATPQHDS
jgi:hypothetical protein